MNQQFTPQDVIKTAKHVIDTQRSNGYKAGWVRFEMERRIEKVHANLDAYRFLAEQIYFVANGEQSLDDLAYWLKESYDFFQEMNAQYA